MQVFSVVKDKGLHGKCYHLSYCSANYASVQNHSDNNSLACHWTETEQKICIGSGISFPLILSRFLEFTGVIII